MTTTIPAPPHTPAPGAPPTAEPAGGPRSRRWLWGFWAAVLIAFLAVSPGRMTFDTKLGVALDPLRFLADLGELWHNRAGFGGIFDQYVGYAFPMLPFYALADLAQVPVWLAERLWLSIIVTTAFWGALRLAERLDIGTARTRLPAAVAYALWPTFTVVIGSTSAAALPGALLPWVLLPLTDPRTPARAAALRSALLIPFMGGVNAASTLASLLPVGLYLLSRPAGPRRRSLLAWWIPGVLLATAWWVVPLLLLGLYGENFLPYVEQSETTTATMSATELLRGAGNWVAYLHFGEAWLPAGWTVATAALTVLCSAFAAALGLAGLARRDIPERRWLLLVVLSVALVTLAGYGGPLGGLFHGTVQDWLNGWLVPFRNIYKFQPGLALALVLGLAHLTAVLARRRGQRAARGRPYVPLIAAALVLPGLLLPYVNGSILQPGAFSKLPTHWERTADWLKEHSPTARALVVPATAHGIYTWGTTIDQPLDVLAESPWAQRDYVPFGTPGNRRALDAVEQALLSGGEVPGLGDYLHRAGLHYVVVRNDLDPDQIGYVPPQTVKRTLEASGYRRTTGFGPVLTGGRIPDDTPVQIEGLYPRQQAVEIYEPPRAVQRPGQAAVKPVADTAVVSGGPESLLRLSADPLMRDRPAVLAGDATPGLGTPPVRAVGDGLRRADTRFGLVNTNTSYTYTATERNPSASVQDPGRPPRQILPVDDIRHQTTAVLRGAASVTASSSGNWLFHLPQYDPVNAFDGNPDTAWTEGGADSPVGQWLRVEFERKLSLPGSIRLTPLPSGGLRAAATSVRVETEQGSEVSPLRPDGTPQTVRVPAGQSGYLKITIKGAQQGRPGLIGAGFSSVDIPGVTVTRLLALPEDTAGEDSAPQEVYSLHRGSDPGGLSPASAEVGLHRQFLTRTEGAYALRATALPVPGDALDELLYRLAPEQRRKLTATADSTARLGASLSPRNLVDGDLTTAWIAGERAVIHLRWPEKRAVGEIVFAPAGGLSTRAQQVEISSPDGAATASVDENGLARFQPITTDRLDITISRTAPLTLHNPVADGRLQLPVGLSEVYVPALDAYRVPQPDPDTTFELPCGQGPVLSIDGTLHATTARGKVRDLTERRPVDVGLCAGAESGGTARLAAGTHRVEAGDTGPLAITDLTLTRGRAPAPATAAERRELTVGDWSGDRRTLDVGTGPASYLQLFENHNDGWRATLDGRELTPVRIDGWQQGFLIPEGEGGSVRLEFAPARWYVAGLIGGAVGVVLLVGLVLALARGRRSGAAEPDEVPAPGPVLGVVALTVVIALVAGWAALVVPVLAVIAHLRRSLLVPVALAAMGAAGIVAAWEAGALPSAREGAFGPAAQFLAVTALTAAVVTTGRATGRRAARSGPGGRGDARASGAPGHAQGPPAAGEAPRTGHTPPEQAGADHGARPPAPDTRPEPRTTPLPQRRRTPAPRPPGEGTGR
ncbi:alpha-(1-_3)-arabinofuranosyltransferase family protein [Streptomyces sp. CB03238]|uniref:alpha-(1->3)-arabinofuranosyltransferase domain-containing protein n=1 Tax=Streptomyces sp. CB03238 TaxID=1907777 RepID=UPI000A0F866B|nr:alpha-(1->3)-arabinofuranosyltransferase family protein [Streptomyces sp. CB03238]ORT57190.1 coagulation factor 5/8 type domain-containing protein [Streptomyces sp. CB03238]